MPILAKTTDVRNSSKEPAGYLKTSDRETQYMGIPVQCFRSDLYVPRGRVKKSSCPAHPVSMPEDYQKRMGSSTYLIQGINSFSYAPYPPPPRPLPQLGRGEG
jgi:hypothetical protein